MLCPQMNAEFSGFVTLFFLLVLVSVPNKKYCSVLANVTDISSFVSGYL